MIYFWSGKPMNHFQKQGKIQNPRIIAEIMNKKGFCQISFWLAL